METALKALSVGGGRSGGSSFLFNGSDSTIASAALGSAATSENILYVVPPATSFNYQGLATSGMSLGSDAIIQYLTGVYLTPATALTGVTNFGMNIRIYRAGALVNTGSTLFAGWTSFPTFVAMTPVLMPWVVANTSVIAPYGLTTASSSTAISNVGIVGLQALDVVTLFFNNTSGGSVTPPTLYVSLEVV